MKLSGDFDARCLRGQQQAGWGRRLAGLLRVGLGLTALLCALTGVLSLSGVPPRLAAPPGVGLSLLACALLLGGGVLLLRRRARRRAMRSSGLSLAPHLLRRQG